MKTRHHFTRRQFAKQIGIASGLGVVAPALANIAIVTPEQVEGPFHPIEEQADTDIDLTLIEGHTKRAVGEIILVEGRVLDEQGNVVDNALVDVWQANHHGKYSHEDDPNTAPLDPDFQGWGLMNTSDEGRYRFKTIKPGAYPLSFLGEEGWRCRHIHFRVSHPEFETLTTQMYFLGDPLIAQDQEIAKAPEDQRHLLIAEAVKDEASGQPRYLFNVVLARV